MFPTTLLRGYMKKKFGGQFGGGGMAPLPPPPGSATGAV